VSILYAPWREAWVTRKDRTESSDCIFCTIPTQNKDEEQFVVKRYKHCILMLNRFPYAAGHLLVIPFKHGARLSDFEPEVLAEIMTVSTQTTIALRKMLNPTGFNIGLNIGAGASIPDHLHQHIIPRWKTDISFLELIAETTVININLQEFYINLKKALE